MKYDKQPINNVQWVDRDKLSANDYNPNRVSPVELNLLKLSILEDGWTQPIVAHPETMTIIDGYHRWRVSDDKELRAMTGGKVPVVFTTPGDIHHQQMSTIRHNRARGTHVVMDMSNIVTGMVKAKIPMEEIMKRLGMEEEEVIRLSMVNGIPESDIVRNEEFSASWVPADKSKNK